MTIVQLSRELSYAVGDAVITGAVDGKRFDATKRLEALNSALHMVVNTILGMSTPERKTHHLLNALMEAKEAEDIYDSGYDFSSLGIISDGIESVNVVIDGHRLQARERTVRDFQLNQNQYMVGSNSYPTYYTYGLKLFIEVSIGSYPVESTFYYIRAPKTPSYTVTDANYTNILELPDNFVPAIKDAAAAVLFRGALEPDAAEISMSSAIQQLQLIAGKSLVDADTIGGGRSQ